MQYKINIPFKMKFEVKRINHRNEESRYAILKAKLISHEYPGDLSSEYSIKGIFPSIIKGDIFECTGKFSLSEKYGYSIDVIDVPKIFMPQLKKGIAEFLKTRIKGLGIRTAEKIVEELGLNTIERIDNDYTCLLAVKGITEKRAKKIQEIISEHRRFEDIATFVQLNGLEHEVSILLYETFKDDAIKIIKENPYSISTIPKLDFTYADKFAHNLKVKFNNLERIKGAILHFINCAMTNGGHLCIYKDDLYENLYNFIIEYGSYKQNEYVEITKKDIDFAIEDLVLHNYIVCEMDKDIIYIYRKDYNVIENNIVKKLYNLMTETIEPFCLPSDIDMFLEDFQKNVMKLATLQKRAVYMALGNRVSILTGLPGTGKTQTTNTIVKCIYHIKPHARIVLLAPTGKASRRMTELTQMNALTIHKGIGLNAFNEHAELNEIDADYVIVDESSMIDAYVFNALLSNIGENTRLILVGDYEQLPSVGPGLILRDLINSEKIPVIRLSEIFRQAKDSQITMNAHAIIEGEKNNLKFDHTKGDFYFINTKDKLTVKNRIIKSVENMIKNKGYSIDDIAVLGPIRGGEIGIDELNKSIQRKFNPPSDKPEFYRDNLNIFRLNDKVMQTFNNYDLNVMNGDVGKITDIYTSSGDYVLDIEYPDKDNVINYSSLNEISELELSYCMTIHKSQGSEFPVVIIPVHKSHMHMLNRNLLYTGVTRAKQVVVFVGDLEALYEAMKKDDAINRLSRIKEKIISIFG